MRTSKTVAVIVLVVGVVGSAQAEEADEGFSLRLCMESAMTLFNSVIVQHQLTRDALESGTRDYWDLNERQRQLATRDGAQEQAVERAMAMMPACLELAGWQPPKSEGRQ